MRKLLQYLKPFAGAIAAAVALVFLQAMCDLKLPDYMSDMVNVGIQQGGITDPVPEQTSPETMDRLLLFFTEEEEALLNQDYRREDSLWTRTGKLSAPDRETLSAAFTRAFAAVGSIETLSKDPDSLKALLAQLPAAPENAAGAEAALSGDLFSLLGAMPREQRLEIAAKVAEQYDSAGENMSGQAAVAFLKAEYEALGVDTAAIQRSYILKTGLKMLAVALLAAACTVTVCFLSARVGAGLGRDLRSAVYGRVTDFSNAEFDKFSTSSLITRTTNDISQVQMLVVMAIRMMAYAPVMGIGGIIYALRKSVSMSWIIALGVVVLLSLVGSINAVVMPRFKKMQSLIDRLNQVARENLSGMMVIRAYNTQDFEEQRFDKANRDLAGNTLFVNRVMSAMMPVMMLLMNLMTLLIIWVGAHQVEQAAMQVGDMMAYMQYAMQIVMSFIMVTMMFIMVPRAAVSGDRIAEVLETRPGILDPESPKSPSSGPAPRGTVEFRDVSFRYPGAEEDALEHITFTARPGETTAFIGSTGAGKSTLVNLIPRFYDVTSGQVLVNGIDVREMTQHDLRQEIGYVPQKGTLFSGTIESNLTYGSPSAAEDQVRRSAEIAQAADFIAEKPEQYGAPIAQGGSNVSGGQKQRLSIARALVKNAPIYIFDDSFSALDFKTDARLRKALQENTADAAILLVAQRVGTIRHAAQIIVLEEGRIAGKGTHEELMESCEVYREIAYSQLSKEELE